MNDAKFDTFRNKEFDLYDSLWDRRYPGQIWPGLPVSRLYIRLHLFGRMIMKLKGLGRTDHIDEMTAIFNELYEPTEIIVNSNKHAGKGSDWMVRSTAEELRSGKTIKPLPGEKFSHGLDIDFLISIVDFFVTVEFESDEEQRFDLHKMAEALGRLLVLRDELRNDKTIYR